MTLRDGVDKNEMTPSASMSLIVADGTGSHESYPKDIYFILVMFRVEFGMLLLRCSEKCHWINVEMFKI